MHVNTSSASSHAPRCALRDASRTSRARRRETPRRFRLRAANRRGPTAPPAAGTTRGTPRKHRILLLLLLLERLKRIITTTPSEPLFLSRARSTRPTRSLPPSLEDPPPRASRRTPTRRARRPASTSHTCGEFAAMMRAGARVRERGRGAYTARKSWIEGGPGRRTDRRVAVADVEPRDATRRESAGARPPPRRSGSVCSGRTTARRTRPGRPWSGPPRTRRWSRR